MKGSRIQIVTAVAALGLAVLGVPGPAHAQTYGFYIGQLEQFGSDWCPEGWQRADGSLLSIAANSTLYSVIGTTFGGDGINSFAVPDLRDRAAIGQSNTRPLGAAVGTSSATMLQTQMPTHTHAFNADPTAPVGNSPTNSMMGLFPVSRPIYAPSSANPNTPMNVGMVQPAGQSQPVPIQMPVLATNWCMAMSGIYPPRP